MKIIAVTSYRFDSDYLEDYQKNLAPLVDDYVIDYDKDGVFFLEEGKQRKRLIDLAASKGADWVIVVDPDERLEKNATKKFKKIIENWRGEKIMLQVNFRELYTPDAYRVDGVWKNKTRIIAFPVFSDNEYSQARIHTLKQPLNSDFRKINTHINLYHLKHINPRLRKHRKEIYEKLDPDNQYQKMGYNYLDDESGIKLKSIPFYRTYQPVYREYRIDEAMFDI